MDLAEPYLCLFVCLHQQFSVCIGKFVDKDWLEGIISALRLTPDIDDMETCVIFCGEEAAEEDRDALTERLEEEFPLLEAELLEGGQRHYRWIIGLS